MGALVMGSLVTRFGGAVELDSYSVLVTHIAKNSPIKVAEEIKGQVRGSDITFRWGGERVFGIFAPYSGALRQANCQESPRTPFHPRHQQIHTSDSKYRCGRNLARRRGYKCSH